MIRNERQYRITKAQADKFLAALNEVEPSPASGPGSLHPILAKAQRDSLRSQYVDLLREVAAYESLRAGKATVLEANTWRDLPDALIRARIASGLSQKDLADRLGLKEQQIQRYEATGYGGASFDRMGDVMGALGVHVREEVYLPASGVSIDGLVRRVASAGFSNDFVRSRLLPKSARDGAGDIGALAAASHIGKVFGWSPAELFGAQPLSAERNAFSTARLRVGGNANEVRTTAYAAYAHYISMLLLDATAHLPQKSVPANGVEAYKEIVDQYGRMGFEEALRYAWSLGIPVLPLDDSGAFYGACWRSSGRNVICLKQKLRFQSRWLEVLLHELGHAGQHSEDPDFGIIEEGDTLEERRDSDDERAAMRYARDASLGGRASELAQLCASAAAGRTEWLSRTVPEVASRQGVDQGVLANHIAYVLSRQGQNWWGAATNLQPAGPDPWMICRDVLLEHVDLSALAEPDRDLLVSSLSDLEE